MSLKQQAADRFKYISKVHIHFFINIQHTFRKIHNKAVGANIFISIKNIKNFELYIIVANDSNINKVYLIQFLFLKADN